MRTPSPTPAEHESTADIDLDLLDYLQSLSPAERIRRNDEAADLVRALRQAGARHYGFDPRAAQKSY